MSDLEAVARWLESYERDGEERWERLRAWLGARFEREITVEAALFLMGIQSRGRGYEPKIHRDRKQDVIMDGTFCAFESIGFYDRVGMEHDGAWIWERRVTPPEGMSIEDQERLLKVAILEYFEREGIAVP